jgi:hypothetical protein
VSVVVGDCFKQRRFWAIERQTLGAPHRSAAGLHNKMVCVSFEIPAAISNMVCDMLSVTGSQSLLCPELLKAPTRNRLTARTIHRGQSPRRQL